MKYCPKCGATNEDTSLYCTNCGSPLSEKVESVTIEPNKTTADASSSNNGVSNKSRGLAAILCGIFYCIGIGGIHRFYAGKIGTGILWLLTAGVFGIGQLVDLIMILCGSFEDIDGNTLTDWKID